MTPEELKEALELAEHIGQNENCYRPEAVTVSRALLYVEKKLRHYTTPRPIAEAPKDGAWVLGINEYGDITNITWDEKSWYPPSGTKGNWREHTDNDLFNPTHFYPLPPAPEGE